MRQACTLKLNLHCGACVPIPGCKYHLCQWLRTQIYWYQEKGHTIPLTIMLNAKCENYWYCIVRCVYYNICAFRKLTGKLKNFLHRFHCADSDYMASLVPWAQAPLTYCFVLLFFSMRPQLFTRMTSKAIINLQISSTYSLYHSDRNVLRPSVHVLF